MENVALWFTRSQMHFMILLKEHKKTISWLGSHETSKFIADEEETARSLK